MEGQQYQGNETDIMIEYVKDGSWTVEQLATSRDEQLASKNPDLEWLVSTVEAIAILQPQS